MTSSAEVGRQLEQRIAAFFQTHGYLTRCNEIREGRSGGRHEIDVLAEKSDALTTYRVAVECKAWQQPIEKDVVSKLHYVLGDLGLNKGIVVSLAGCRAGAERTAADLGIELWGPDELRRQLGDVAVGELTVPLPTVNTTLAWGYIFRASPAQAEKLIRSSGKGRLGLRTLERLAWLSPIWVPAYSVRLTVAQPEVKRLKTRLRSTTLDNLYEALGGTFLGRVPGPWEQVQIEQTPSLRPTMRDTKVHAAVRKAVQDYERVSSPSAVQRHASRLAGLGVPTPCSSLSIDQTSLVYLPYFVGILDGDGRQRAVAVTGRAGDLSDPMSRVLTTNLAQLRTQFVQ
jgi:Restriction endonuclease